jgi:ABC-type branched-subunit amino acid transport system ATPase component
VNLEARNLIGGYGRVEILHDVSIRLGGDGMVAILGPNGAGKSTLLKTLAGHLPSLDGELLLDGERYDGRDARWAARAGIVLVPQTRSVFPDLSVAENLRLGALYNPRADDAIAAAMDRFPVLRERGDQAAGSLSGGERQILAISSAVLMEPKVLLLDEPTTGLSPMAAESTAELIGELIESGMTVAWVVEQLPELALERAARAYFIEAGQVTFEGEASALLEEGRLEELMLQHA